MHGTPTVHHMQYEKYITTCGERKSAGLFFYCSAFAEKALFFKTGI